MNAKSIFIIFLLIACSVAAQTSLKVIKINNVDAVKGQLIIKFKSTMNSKLPSAAALERTRLMQTYNARSIKKWNIGAELWKLGKGSVKQAVGIPYFIIKKELHK